MSGAGWLFRRPINALAEIQAEPLDVWSFRATERLKVHEDRQAADNTSAVVRGSVKRYRLVPWPWRARRVA